MWWLQKNIINLSLLNFKTINLFCSTFLFYVEFMGWLLYFYCYSTSFGTTSSGWLCRITYFFFCLVIFRNAKSQTNVVVSYSKTRKYSKTFEPIAPLRTRVFSNAMKSQPYIIISPNRQPQIGTGTLFHNQDVRRVCVELKSL